MSISKDKTDAELTNDTVTTNNEILNSRGQIATSRALNTRSNFSKTMSQEKVFLCTNRKPVETSTTFGNQMIGSQNNYDTFLRNQDTTKLEVFRNFKHLSRDLT